MNKVSNEEIKKIANLARIELNEQEAEEFSEKVSDIVDWVEALNKVNTDNVEPMMAVDNKLNMREDKISDGGKTDELLENCAERKFDFFSVPKFVN